MAKTDQKHQKDIKNDLKSHFSTQKRKILLAMLSVIDEMLEHDPDCSVYPEECLRCHFQSALTNRGCYFRS